MEKWKVDMRVVQTSHENVPMRLVVYLYQIENSNDLTLSAHIEFELIIWRVLRELMFCSCNSEMDILCLVYTLIRCK